MLLDQVQPRWQFRERHHTTVRAPAGAVLAAVTAVTWPEVPVFRLLMAARALGHHRLRADRRILDDMVGIGFAPLARSATEVVYGGVGQPWRIAGGLRRLDLDADPAAAFEAVREPGWARMAVDFRYADGRLHTETRVWVTDPVSRRRFRRYWRLVRPFSGLIRRSWLAAIRRRAERSAAGR